LEPKTRLQHAEPVAAKYLFGMSARLYQRILGSQSESGIVGRILGGNQIVFYRGVFWGKAEDKGAALASWPHACYFRFSLRALYFRLSHETQGAIQLPHVQPVLSQQWRPVGQSSVTGPSKHNGAAAEATLLDGRKAPDSTNDKTNAAKATGLFTLENMVMASPKFMVS
jgi:hypothetical protein